MEPITAKLKRTRLFAHLHDDAIAGLIERPGVARGAAGDPVVAHPGDLVVVLEGGLAMTSEDGEHQAAFSVAAGAREPAILYTIPAGARLELLEPSVYLIVDGGRLDDALSGRQETTSLAGLDSGARDRIASLIKAQPFTQMSFERLCRCAEAMQPDEVQAGDEVVTQGDVGDFFYVIESGTADVLRSGPAGGEPQKLATLGPGATFGEEALLQEGTRNASVRMLTPGRLLRLGRTDFDRLLKSQLLHEIAPQKAHQLLDEKKAALIDCRFEGEWELWRLKNARLIPLDQIRERSRGLDPRRTYIVYCRSGRRSGAAAFLMRQAGLDALSLQGGIAQWPYELEGAAAEY